MRWYWGVMWLSYVTDISCGTHYLSIISLAWVLGVTLSPALVTAIVSCSVSPAHYSPITAYQWSQPCHVSLLSAMPTKNTKLVLKRIFHWFQQVAQVMMAGHAMCCAIVHRRSETSFALPMAHLSENQLFQFMLMSWNVICRSKQQALCCNEQVTLNITQWPFPMQDSV